MAELREITEADDARKKEEERKKRQGRVDVAALPSENFEHAKVDEIVSRMKQRFDARGYGKEAAGKGAELKEKVTGRTAASLDQRLPADMAGARGFAGFAGKMHRLLPFINAITNRVAGYSLARRLPQQLDKANMTYSAKQFVGMAVVASLFVGIFTLVLSAAVAFTVLSEPLTELATKMTTTKGPLIGSLIVQGIDTGLIATGIKYFLLIAVSFLVTMVGFIVSLLVAFQMPANRSLQRGKAIDKELPFALRHMATEIKAGIGIHKTMESIVEADYGELSVEFKRTLREIDKGTSTDDALMAMGERSPSENLSKALMHMVRTLKTGGNLTVIIQTLASDVAFELRMKMRDFVERLNLVGLFYMMLGIVFPVFIAVLAGIFNAIPTIGLAGILGTQTLFLIYFMLIPMGLGLILYIIKVMQPM